MSALPDVDPRDAARALGATGLLAEFNAAGVLAAADVHVARRLGVLADEHDEEVLLAVALAVRGPRLGHVHVDLATIRDRAAVDTDTAVDVRALPWPDPAAWLERVANSPLTTGEHRPLHLQDTTLYLDRYRREEEAVARDLLALAQPATGVDAALLEDGIRRHFGDEATGRQAQAAAAAVRHRLAVVAGGPGTGKTTTIAKIVALLEEQAPGTLIALAAPTGKAAARMQEAVGRDARTLHRLLGWRPGSHSRFHHDRTNRLPYDVVIVDETSMVSLSLMARLVESVREGARLVLVGDPNQLTSIEAGVVLGDVVGAAMDGGPLHGGVVVLDEGRRFGGAIAPLADAVREGDADAAIAILDAKNDDVVWHRDEHAAEDALRREATTKIAAVARAAQQGDARAALDALQAFRLLCAHRRGPYGVATWTEKIERWLADHIDKDRRWYAGRPLLVTENDYGLRLYNGDTGVVIAGEDGTTSAAFDRGDEIVTLRPGRLEAVESVYAMTIHKSQGSQFGTAAVLLPPEDSPLLTRELLYTAATRAQQRLVVAGSEAAVRAAIGRPAQRASGLRQRLIGNRAAR